MSTSKPAQQLPSVAVEWTEAPTAAFRAMESRTAQNCAHYLLPTLESMKQSNPNLKLLDVGCGHGSISATLAQLIPKGHVTALDINASIVPRAKAVAKGYGVGNIEFVTAGMHKLPFEDGVFDVVHCHQVLAHNKEPWNALKEMLRVTKPGGVVASREGDTESEIWWPRTPAMQKAHDYTRMLITSHGGGGSSTAGRELLSWVLKTGVKRSQVTPSYSVWHFTEKADKEIWGTAMLEGALSGITRDKVVAGGMKEEELEEMRQAWREFMERDDATLIMTQGEMLIRKE